MKCLERKDIPQERIIELKDYTRKRLQAHKYATPASIAGASWFDGFKEIKWGDRYSIVTEERQFYQQLLSYGYHHHLATREEEIEWMKEQVKEERSRKEYLKNLGINLG